MINNPFSIMVGGIRTTDKMHTLKLAINNACDGDLTGNLTLFSMKKRTRANLSFNSLILTFFLSGECIKKPDKSRSIYTWTAF